MAAPGLYQNISLRVQPGEKFYYRRWWFGQIHPAAAHQWYVQRVYRQYNWSIISCSEITTPANYGCTWAWWSASRIFLMAACWKYYHGAGKPGDGWTPDALQQNRAQILSSHSNRIWYTPQQWPQTAATVIRKIPLIWALINKPSLLLWKNPGPGWKNSTSYK